MLLPADLRQRLSPDSVNCLDPVKMPEVLSLLEELKSFEVRGRLMEWCRHCGVEPAAHQISLPALAEPGDPLGRALGEPLWCDDDYGYGGQLVELSTKTPARTWSALYQQRPAPEEGDYFHAD